MPALTNSSIIAQAKPICAALRAKGLNWDWDAQSALIVRFILSELDPAYLGDDYKTERKEFAAVVKQFGYPKNCQQSYLSMTPSGEVDEKGNAIMLMPKVEGKAAAVNDYV